MAEAIFNKLAPEGFTIKSVGTKVFDKEGNSVDGEKLRDREGAKGVIEVLHEIGIDVRDAERNQITEEAVHTADVIVSMAERNTLPDYLQGNSKIRFWDIEDPKGKGIEELRRIRDQVTGLAKNLTLELGG